MRLRPLNVGCFGGGTGLPSLLGGLKNNPWLHVNAVVTMFDSGGSSGQLRDELGVLPPGDVLRCALALAPNEAEARRVLLARLPTLEHSRLGGHTGGNLLLSMMEQYSGDFLAAVEGLRALLGCQGRVWPVSVERASLCAEYSDGHRSLGEVEAAEAVRAFDAVVIGPGSFYTSLMPIFLVQGVVEALAAVRGPVILIANLLTEGRGMRGFTAAEAVERIAGAIRRPVDVVIHNTGVPAAETLARYAEEHKEPLPLGCVPAGCQVVSGDFWSRDIARHDRRRLAYAVWTVLSQRLLT
jgi:2-phospho-L-lactate transferase/gluconeogenesis factor (CofD/UPF0052 family)